jgi:hypothetical protein
MPTRIEFTGTMVVYDDEPVDSGMEAAGWVNAALLYGDKHSGEFTTSLVQVDDFYEVDEDE